MFPIVLSVKPIIKTIINPKIAIIKIMFLILVKTKLTPINININDSITNGEFISPNSVELIPTFIIPEFIVPTYAINNPIITAAEILKLLDIDSIMVFLNGVIQIIKYKIPESITLISASPNDNPNCWDSVYVKKAFIPIPGAAANGTFANIPRANVDRNDDIAVPKNKEPIYSFPTPIASDKILGFTNKMYTIAKNVEIPPIISFLKVLFLVSILK